MGSVLSYLRCSVLPSYTKPSWFLPRHQRRTVSALTPTLRPILLRDFSTFHSSQYVLLRRTFSRTHPPKVHFPGRPVSHFRPSPYGPTPSTTDSGLPFLSTDRLLLKSKGRLIESLASRRETELCLLDPSGVTRDRQMEPFGREKPQVQEQVLTPLVLTHPTVFGGVLLRHTPSPHNRNPRGHGPRRG